MSESNENLKWIALPRTGQQCQISGLGKRAIQNYIYGNAKLKIERGTVATKTERGVKLVAVADLLKLRKPGHFSPAEIGQAIAVAQQAG